MTPPPVMKVNDIYATKAVSDSKASAQTSTTTVTDVSGDESRRRRSHSATSFDDVSIATAAAAPARRRSEGLINPWRELNSDAFVIAYAMKGTARCSACMSKVAKGELQVRGHNIIVHL